ncbi:MAG: hypothetical protein CMJ64_20350 [Planctomycetaceae bacterium]|nr:hypothetical protein [Planctomycetaceae bacterium]
MELHALGSSAEFVCVGTRFVSCIAAIDSSLGRKPQGAYHQPLAKPRRGDTHDPSLVSLLRGLRWSYAQHSWGLRPRLLTAAATRLKTARARTK